VVLNPSEVMVAIAAGAQKSEKLVVGGIVKQPKPNGSTWELVTDPSGACRMRKIVFDMLKSGSMHVGDGGVQDGTIDVPVSSTTTGGNFMLTPIVGLGGVLYAELRDPVFS